MHSCNTNSFTDGVRLGLPPQNFRQYPMNSSLFYDDDLVVVAAAQLCGH